MGGERLLVLHACGLPVQSCCNRRHSPPCPSCRVERLSLRPRAFLLHGFLSNDEADYIIQAGHDRTCWMSHFPRTHGTTDKMLGREANRSRGPPAKAACVPVVFSLPRHARVSRCGGPPTPDPPHHTTPHTHHPQPPHHTHKSPPQPPVLAHPTSAACTLRLQAAMPELQRSGVVGPDGKEMLDDIRTRYVAGEACWLGTARGASHRATAGARLRRPQPPCLSSASLLRPAPVHQRSSGTFLLKDRDPALKVRRRAQPGRRLPTGWGLRAASACLAREAWCLAGAEPRCRLPALQPGGGPCAPACAAGDRGPRGSGHPPAKRKP